MKNEKPAPLSISEIIESSERRVQGIGEEFRKGFEFIKNYPRSVSFFGSARTNENEEDYRKARQLASRIIKDLHYAVLTGGGPGIMEAANRGAYETGGNSAGLTIELPQEQVSNKYLTDELSFHHFFSRKVCLSFAAEAYVFFPGGFGTLDEFGEIITLVQTNKIPRVPIILVGRSYWKNLEHFFRESMLSRHLIDEEDLALFTITDDEDEIIEIIKNSPVRFSIEYKKTDL